MWKRCFTGLNEDNSYITFNTLSLLQLHSAKETGRRWTIIHTKKQHNRLASETVKSTVKVHCNLRLVDNIEEIVRSDAIHTPILTGLRVKTWTD